MQFTTSVLVDSLGVPYMEARNVGFAECVYSVGVSDIDDANLLVGFVDALYLVEVVNATENVVDEFAYIYSCQHLGRWHCARAYFFQCW